MSEIKAVRYHEYGDSGKLTVESVPRPAPKAGEVLVRVHFSGVNPVDWKLRSGMYKAFMPVTFPSTPGREFSGVVEEAGQGVTGLQQGAEGVRIGRRLLRGVRRCSRKGRCAHSERRHL